MSAKWERSKRWDDEHIPRALWPVKWVLRALSSIWLAVVLLSLVVCYGILASIPIGMLAQIPTYAVYGLTLVGTIAVLAGVPWMLARRGMSRASRPARFAVLFVVVVVMTAAAAGLWFRFAWPALHYDPASGRGLMLFSGFVKANSATTLRRLPILEMSELEFYSWWPLRAILLLFVLNLVVATVRRIEFIFVNLGVLTVHTGIVTIALGSVYYAGLKQEGDTILLAGRPDSTGVPGPGPEQDVFYDNTEVSLYVAQERGWEERPLRGVPRYNDYNLAALAGTGALEASRRTPREWREAPARTLDAAVPASYEQRVDPGLRFRVVGFASYAEPLQDWVRVDEAELAGAGPDVPALRANPLRMVYLVSDLPDAAGKTSSEPVFAFTLLPREAKSRVADARALSIEYVREMPGSRYADLTSPLPAGTRHALVVDVPGRDGREPLHAVYPVQRGGEVKVGETGYVLSVKEITPQPPFPIITEGYRDAQSSVAVVRVTRPDGTGYDRWVYHRFPEINQDMLDEVNERGMPRRRDADPEISIRYLDADQVQVYFDERADGSCRAIVRRPGGELRTETLPADGTLKDMVPGISLRLGEGWAHAEPVDRPLPVAESQRDRSLIGTRDKAMLGVEVTLTGAGKAGTGGANGAGAAGPAWKRVVWLPFTKYLAMGLGTERTLDLPDGRLVKLAFGRRRHPLGDPRAPFHLSLVNFEMIAYDHRGAPRDYQSVLRVEPTDGRFEPYEHVTKLNAPLRAPFMWSGSRSWLANVGMTIASGLNPFQFKLSQAGWDAEGWKQTQQLADQGLIPRPYASFTILGVGNNPGIHIIALGAVLMAVGIPWAFYVKPWLLRRRKAKIQAQLKAGTYKPPAKKAASGAASGGGNGVATVAVRPAIVEAEAVRFPARSGEVEEVPAQGEVR